MFADGGKRKTDVRDTYYQCTCRTTFPGWLWQIVYQRLIETPSLIPCAIEKALSGSFCQNSRERLPHLACSNPAKSWGVCLLYVSFLLLPEILAGPTPWEHCDTTGRDLLSFKPNHVIPVRLCSSFEWNNDHSKMWQNMVYGLYILTVIILQSIHSNQRSPQRQVWSALAVSNQNIKSADRNPEVDQDILQGTSAWTFHRLGD